MKKFLAGFFDKYFYEDGWTIGICKGDIKDIIRSRMFNADITWLKRKAYYKSYADPFIFKANGNYHILIEEYKFNDDYGKISLMTIDKAFKPVYNKILLDTKSHLSYPFVFAENNKIYIFPEAGKSGKLSCYEYNPVQQSLIFSREIIDLPVVDPTILKYNNKYWLFGTLKGDESLNKLYIYFSDNLFGPYAPHAKNPVKDTLSSSRPAGNFIELDGILYRPSQNCENQYGESIMINKINELNECRYEEEPYMSICINKKNKRNNGIYKIHTINILNDIILVDGGTKVFTLIKKFKEKITSIPKLGK